MAKQPSRRTQLNRAEAAQRRAKRDPKLAEEQKWDAAERRARGEKVRDDPALLRKTLRAKASAKRKSAREWADRKKALDRTMKDRADKREQNIRDHRAQLGVKGKVRRAEKAADDAASLRRERRREDAPDERGRAVPSGGRGGGCGPRCRGTRGHGR